MHDDADVNLLIHPGLDSPGKIHWDDLLVSPWLLDSMALCSWSFYFAGYLGLLSVPDVSLKATLIAYLALMLPVHLEVPQEHRQCASRESSSFWTLFCGFIVLA